MSIASARAYWDNAAERYDEVFSSSLTGQARRRIVWRALGRAFQPGQHILELNCGTGVDAVHLASRGIHVLSCDISPRMVQLARQLASDSKVSNRVEFRVLANENIEALADEGPFDGGFSSFSGLNCVEDLPAVAKALALLLPRGARFIAGITGRLVPWEIAWFLAHGDARKALRFRRNDADFSAHPVLVKHYTIRQMQSIFADGFQLKRWEGLGIAVPPTYMEHWAARFPGLTKGLTELDLHIGQLPFFRRLADGVLLEFERR
jgi:SAM-dependent methyltransferase